MLDWEDVDECNFCGGRDFREYMNSSLPAWFEEKPLRLIECRNCRLVAASPRPDRYQVYADYREAGLKAQEATERKLARPNIEKIHRRAVDQSIEKHGQNPKTLFDMGCGAGSVMRAARDAGLEASGNDINLHSIEKLRSEGFNAIHGFTRDIEIPSDQFDIVISFDYFEHSYEPQDDLKKCFDILRPNGIISLKTLYLDCPNHILRNERWKLFGRGHYHFFWPRTLKAMVEAAGFRVEGLRLSGLIRIVGRKAL